VNLVHIVQRIDQLMMFSADKRTPVQELTEKLNMLRAKQLVAYRANVSHQLLAQFNQMISEAEQELYDQIQLEQSRNIKDDDESWIV
jgi:hypothetical protein